MGPWNRLAADNDRRARKTRSDGPSARAVSMLCIGLAVACGAVAGPSVCDNHPLTETHKLDDLPSGVSHALNGDGVGRLQLRLIESTWTAAEPQPLGDVPRSLKEVAALLKAAR